MIKITSSILSIPNFLSFLRFFLTFPILWFLSEKLYVLAFVFFLLSSLSDLLDGHLARKWKKETDIGAWLDSIADNIFNISLILFFYFSEKVPLYYLILLLMRNGVHLIHSLIKFGKIPGWMGQGKKVGLNRWEPSMVFFVLFFLFFKEVLGPSSGPVYKGIEAIILPYVFMPLSAATNLIVTLRYLTTDSKGAK
ncbi:MAG: hypothetical protein CME63_03095 [Halobacteriovoraceae bacterium]|nr:hypothetical protein [Halobacteriovoraceae bacterium]MBC96707.1 hypothetical protein [Halobacteriovoraceae bacterium]